VEFAFHPPRIHSNLITRKSDQLLIGRKGETLNALEHILYQAFKRRFPDFKLRLDISGYKKKRNSYLMHKARALAKFVKETKREITFDYVNEDEERIVRQALRREKGIKVYVVGRGEKRNLVIAPLK
jgi:spoIIIJ-associated protein